MTDAVAVPLLEARDIVKHYRVGGLLGQKIVHALDVVSLSVATRETVAVVGESGCGKSTLGRCLVALEEPTSGILFLRGAPSRSILSIEPLRFRRDVQIVFQDPYASLNPRRTIGQSLDDPLRVHRMGNRVERREQAEQLMLRVGLQQRHLDRYPHELSGGQRQRVAIARALAPGPSLIVCDEAVSSLDVSVQAQIINLLRDIQKQTGVAYVFITHNLHLVKRFAQRIVVMYLGQIVEEGTTEEMTARFLHPYSAALFAAAPKLWRGGVRPRATPPIGGDVPSPFAPPSGCRFHTRCPIAQDSCRTVEPSLRQVAGRTVRCHLAE